MSAGWIRADWPVSDTVVGGCTLRTGGVSTGVYDSLNLGTHVEDERAAVLENRRRFAAMCDLPSEPRWLRQVHQNQVVVDPEPGTEADAALTKESGVVCVVQTADCLPILLAAADGREVAAAHAGWRGLAAGVIEATVGMMSTPARDVIAWFGPAISQAAFEVGDEVRQAFLADEPAADACFRVNEHGRWQADLHALARLRLGKLGIGQIHGGGLCTHSDDTRFFSYRRDGQCGRMATFVFKRA